MADGMAKTWGISERAAEKTAAPQRVAQSADPLSDRRVSLEVTATILR